jgi:hypothetical protein
MSDLLTTSWGRLFAGITAALAVATALGLVVLWPSGDSDVELGPALAADSERAEVRAIESFACSGFQTDTCRRVEVALLSGPDAGQAAELELGTGGLDPELSIGEEVRVVAQAGPGAGGPRGSSDAPLLWLALVFAALVIVFGRLRGALSLVGLGLSLVVVVLFIVPALLEGASPLAVAIIGSFAVMLATVPLAHGLGPKSVAAILGTAASLLLTVALAVLFVDLTSITGLSDEDALILQANQLDVSPAGLVLAAIVIGALGVLDDMTVSQASTVMALRAANPTQGFRSLFTGALRVGRDHVSATVNTLVLAYVGAALPVLLIFSSGTVEFVEAVNFEVVAAPIIATLVGSIGLIAAAPITTALAALLAGRLPAERLADAASAHAGHAH